MLNTNEQGFTLVEICIAIVILTAAVLGLAASTGQMLTPTADAELEFAALQAVEDRLSEIRFDPRYSLLDSLYEGTETGLAGLDSMVRVTDITQTRVQQTGGGWLDYRTVVVDVSGGRLTNAVSRKLIIGAPGL